MDSSDLAFFTTQELIAELMSRETFYGVVVHTDGDHKSDDWSAEKTFKVHLHRHLGVEGASRLLGKVSDYMSEWKE